MDNALREGYDIGRELSETERLISESEKNIASIESEKALRLNDAEHYRRMARQYGEDISVNNRELALAADMLSAAAEVGKELESEHAKVKEEFALAEEAYAKYRDAAVACAQQEQDAVSAQTKAYETVSGLREIYAAIKAKSEESVRARDEAEAQLSASAARMKDLQFALDKASLELFKAENEVKENAENKSAITEKCDENRALRNQLNEKLSAVNLEISALEHRRENLRRMEALFEGYSDGVKNVMNASELTGIVGTVSSVVSTEEKYVLALETALGASAQFIITEKEADAKNAVKYLKKTSGGRATFLPIETVTGNRVNEEPFKNVKGYIGIASDMVKSDKRFRTVIDDLLGRTVLTENMDSATSSASACGYKVKVVTLDGQVVNPGGSITGGSAHKKAGLFTRAMDIDRLSADIKTKRTETEKLEADISDADSVYDTLCAEKKAAEDAYNSAVALRNDRQRECDGAQVRLEEENNHNEAIRLQASRQVLDAEIPVPR